MYKILAIVSLVISSFSNSFSQTNVPPLDKSPMDISFYPDNYPVLKIQDKAAEPLAAKVTYSRPQRNNRVIFGDLIEYGKVWRLGANEATEIEFFQNVKISNTKIKKGRYTLYAIPSADKWALIVNKELNTWGSFKYDSTKDIVRVDVPVQKQTDTTEAFSIYFEKATAGFVLNTVWENIKVSLPISLQ
ncbi:MAG: DUF2911 domain-containing protein [Ferruginibacter sp.]